MRSRSEQLNLTLFCPTDSTVKGAYSAISAANVTPVPTLPLLQIEGVATKEDAQFYLLKGIYSANHPSLTLSAELWHLHSVAYVYRAKRQIAGSNVRVIWG